MAVKWHSTNFPGVRYYKHESRKHGVKFDQYYSIRFQVDGKTFEEGLGWASEGMSADKAYKTRSDLKEAAKSGEGSPTLKQRRREKAKAEESAPTLETAAKKFIERCERSLRPKTARYYKDGLAKAQDFIPSKGTGKLKTWKMEEIQRRHLAALIEDISAKSTSVAIQVRSSLSALYAWAAESPREYVQSNMVRDIKRPPKPAPRERYLTGEEAGTLWKSLIEVEALALNEGDEKSTKNERRRARENAGDPAMIRLLQFSLLVGCRLSEAAGMTRQEISGDWWEIPSSRFKGKRAHRVYLTETAKRLTIGTSDLVFPSSRAGKKKVSGEPFDPSSVSRYLKRKNYFGLPKFTCHDFRRTLGSGLAMQGISLEVIAAVIGHKLQGVTAEHYIRHKYDDEKQTALTCWEQYLIQQVGEEKRAEVIPLRKG